MLYDRTMGNMQKMFWVLMITLLVTAGFIFSTQNAQQVSVQFGTWASRPVPLAATIFAAFAVGFLISYFSAILQMLHLRSSEKKSRRTVQLLEKEIHTLRNQPILEELTVDVKTKKQSDRSLPPAPRRFPDDYETGELN